MFQIFRIEHRETRIGPFQTNEPFLQEMAKTAGRLRYLRPPSDVGLNPVLNPWNFVFGAPHLDALKEWVFLGHSVEENAIIVQRLTSLGFVVAEFLVESDRIRRGFQSRGGVSSNQLLFDADSSREAGLVTYHSPLMMLEASPLVFSVGSKGLAVLPLPEEAIA